MNLADWIFGPLTVYLEAEGETDEGKLAVAFVIANRARRSGKSVVDTVLSPYQFSCWNTSSPRRGALDALEPVAFGAALRAWASAAWGLVPDPTGGATHFLNVATVRAVSGRLPGWATRPGTDELDPARVTATIGQHTFLLLEE